MRARREQRDYVGMFQRGRELNLASKRFHVHTGAHLGWQNLHDHLPMESSLFGEENAAHPAAAELLG